MAGSSPTTTAGAWSRGTAWKACAEMTAKFPGLELLFVESGGDNLDATFSPELADITLYVIDVAGGR